MLFQVTAIPCLQKAIRSKEDLRKFLDVLPANCFFKIPLALNPHKILNIKKDGKDRVLAAVAKAWPDPLTAPPTVLIGEPQAFSILWRNRRTINKYFSAKAD